ncbi:MAG: S41 family peptidase [Vampirovibrionales bacterium]|nr:S41 family peptidase [Vampirovibrionales bacterium]
MSMISRLLNKKMVSGLLALLVTVGALLTLGTTSPAWAHTPASLYDDVWKLVNARFVDDSKNGQDWRIWRHRYDGVLEDDKDAYVAIDTMLNSLNDRYSRFLDPEAFDEEGQSIKATLYGIGIQIGNRGNKLLIIAPMDDTPAAKAGLLSEDEIIKIDDVEAKGMNVKDAANLIRGKRGTYVRLLIRRPIEAKAAITPENKLSSTVTEKPPVAVSATTVKTIPMDSLAADPAKTGLKEKEAVDERPVEEKWYSVERDEIKLKSIELNPPFKTEIPKEMGYIRLTTFLSSNASEELKNALLADKKKQGIILDLRSNPGGLLSNAITIADYFLDGEAAIVSTVDRDGYKEIQAADDTLLTSQPLVVLIDKGSASASEILSGALRDNNRAILVGQTSFGKGLVQEINQLPGGSGVNLTTQRYLTPNDTDINKTGIVPDIAVAIAQEDIAAKKDKQLDTAVGVMKDWIAGKSMKYLQSRSLVAPKG